jgi:hypothetical protein
MPEFSPHEIGDRFLFVRRLRPAKRFGDNPPARHRGQQGTCQQGLRRHRDLLQLAVPQDESRRLRVRRAKFACDPEFANQIEQHFRSLKALRPRFEEKTIFFHGADQAARLLFRFEQNERHAELLQPVGAG